MTNPYEYRVEADREGFLIVDEYGEEVTPTIRHSSWQDAQTAISQMILDDIAAQADEASE